MLTTSFTELRETFEGPTLIVYVPPLPPPSNSFRVPPLPPVPPSLDKAGHKWPQLPLLADNRGRRYRRFYHRVRSGLTRPGQHALLTLTSSPESTQDIHRSFRILRKRLARLGFAFPYLCVKESTKSGLLHLHLLIRERYIPQSLISRLWEEVHHARIVYIQRIKGIRFVQRYLAKYLRKGTARYWITPSWMPTDWHLPWACLIRAGSRHRLPWAVVRAAWHGYCQGKYRLYFFVRWSPGPPGQVARDHWHHLCTRHPGWTWKNLINWEAHAEP